MALTEESIHSHILLGLTVWTKVMDFLIAEMKDPIIIKKYKVWPSRTWWEWTLCFPQSTVVLTYGLQRARPDPLNEPCLVMAIRYCIGLRNDWRPTMPTKWKWDTSTSNPSWERHTAGTAEKITEAAALMLSLRQRRSPIYGDHMWVRYAVVGLEWDCLQIWARFSLWYLDNCCC